MSDFLDFLGFINEQLDTRQIPRLESFLMPANFSSMVGEFMTVAIPKYCRSIVKNNITTAIPTCCPRQVSRRFRFARHDGNRNQGFAARQRLARATTPKTFGSWCSCSMPTVRGTAQGIAPKPFRFVKVVGAQLDKSDWAFSGRSATSRRTITASVTRTGFEKMEANWIYRAESE